MNLVVTRHLQPKPAAGADMVRPWEGRMQTSSSGKRIVIRSRSFWRNPGHIETQFG